MTTVKHLQKQAVEAIRAYNADLRPDGLREAAEALVEMRQHFATNDGEVDWRGRSWPYREAVSEVYASVGVPSEDLPSLQSAVRYHVGNVVRERLSASEVKDLGLMAAGPRERTREFRESRASLVKTIMPQGELDDDDIIRLAVMIEGLLVRIESEAPNLDSAHLIALRYALEAADSRLARARSRVAVLAG